MDSKVVNKEISRNGKIYEKKRKKADFGEKTEKNYKRPNKSGGICKPPIRVT